MEQPTPSESLQNSPDRRSWSRGHEDEGPPDHRGRFRAGFHDVRSVRGKRPEIQAEALEEACNPSRIALKAEDKERNMRTKIEIG